MVLGFEGSGTIVESIDQRLLGKKVSCMIPEGLESGCWADYFGSNLENALIFDEITIDMS
jgi:NADPH:quinone reductase-like Zn-dependent oxidoreductase